VTTRTYAGVTSEKIEALKSKAFGAGVRVQPDPDEPGNANRCIVKKLTVTARMNYDPAWKTLTVTVSGFGADTALRKIEEYGGLTA
jgi:hypothetical protein